MYRMGPVQQKILLTLSSYVALGLTKNPRQHLRIYRYLYREWKKINKQHLNRSVKSLVDNKLLEERKLANGSYKLVLTKDGKKRAQALSLIGNSIKFKKPKRWDKKWRLVFFDIPERSRRFRDILRSHLYALDFFKMQKSVFVSPYHHEKNIIELADFYSARPYVRVVVADSIDDEDNIKKYFFGNKKGSKK